MRNLLLTLAAGIGLLTAAATGTAHAASSTSTAHYSTAMTELYGGTAPYSGSLDLTVQADGIIHGYYFPADYSSMFVPVVGGKSDDSIWLDIGNSDITHISGRIKDGVIVGTAFTQSNGQYTFVAKPAADTGL